MLFDRKLTKLMSEANFYEEELLGNGKDEFSQKMEELIELKEDSLTEHRNLIEGLTALIR